MQRAILIGITLLTLGRAAAAEPVRLPRLRALGARAAVPSSTGSAAAGGLLLSERSEYERYQSLRNGGRAMTITGLLLMGTGTGMFFGAAFGGARNAAIFGLAIGIGGTVSTLIGLPTWIVGSSGMRRLDSNRSRGISLAPTVALTQGGVFAGIQVAGF